MTTFRATKENAEQELLMRLIAEIEKNPKQSQRDLASELGVAVGLLNAYIKRCVRKGWIKVNRITPRKLIYVVTPEGMLAKGRIIADYLSRSLQFFKVARIECDALISSCYDDGVRSLSLVGDGELSEIMLLIAQSYGIKVERRQLQDEFSKGEILVVCDVADPQKTYDELVSRVQNRRILIPEILRVCRK